MLAAIVWAKATSTISIWAQIYSGHGSQAIVLPLNGLSKNQMYEISEYEFSIEHTPGRNYQDTDALPEQQRKKLSVRLQVGNHAEISRDDKARR